MALEQSLRPKFLEIAIEVCMSVRDPFFIWGPPGAGKSQIAKAKAEELGYRFIDIRMSQLEAIDLRGMPIIPEGFKDKDTVVIWALPHFLPKDPDEKVFIFFDEMNHAVPSNLKAAYQLIQERRLGEYVLPENVVCGAAGNRKEDGGNDFELPKPLQDRFTHFEFQVNVTDWLDWAMNNGIHPLIIGFISAKPEYLQQYSEMSKSMTFATPRSWKTVSDILYKIFEVNNLNEEIPGVVVRALVAGRVGLGIATEFNAYCDIGARLPNPVDILTGKVSNLEDKRIDILFSVTSSLCIKLREFDRSRKSGEITQKEFNLLCDNFFKFIGHNCAKNKDLIIMAVKTAVKTYKIEFDASEMPSFFDFIEEYGPILAKYVAD